MKQSCVYIYSQKSVVAEFSTLEAIASMLRIYSYLWQKTAKLLSKNSAQKNLYMILFLIPCDPVSMINITIYSIVDLKINQFHQQIL